MAANEVAYQGLHIAVPWKADDPVSLIKGAQDAAAGHGLKLTDGKTTLEIASDGRSMQLNGRPYGTLKPGDNVALTADGKLTVNGVERSAEPSPTTAPK